MRLGIDIGNYQVKTSEGVIFDSRVNNEKEFGSNAPSLVFNNETLYLGEGNFDIEARKFDKDSFIPLLLGAITQSTTSDVVDLALGLPIIQYKNKQNREELINKIQGKEFKLWLSGEKRLIYIRSAQVFPEGVAGYLYMLSTDVKLSQEIGKRDCIVIDIGGKTTDIALVQNKRATKPTSIDVGTIDIYDSIMKALQERYYDAKIEKEKIQDYLDHGFYYKGEKQDISFAINKTKDLFKKIYSELKLNYPITTEAVVVIGGGAKILGDVFRKSIPGIIVRDNIDKDVFCNAKGYKMLLK